MIWVIVENPTIWHMALPLVVSMMIFSVLKWGWPEIERRRQKLEVEKKPLWANNTKCPVYECGKPIDPRIRSVETGFNYCSFECAKKDVKNWSERLGED